MICWCRFRDECPIHCIGAHGRICCVMAGRARVGPAIHGSSEVSPRQVEIRSSRRLPFGDQLWRVSALNGTAASGLGVGAGVKSQSPLAGARVAGLEAGTNAQAPSFVSFSSDRSCASSLRPSSRSLSQPCRPCGVAPHQLISGRRSRRPHHKPPCAGQRAGQSGSFFKYGIFQPDVDAIPCPGLRRADQARPNLVVSVIAWRDVPSSFRFRRHLAHAAFSTAPCGTTPCFT
jgi:hypothetical protein